MISVNILDCPSCGGPLEHTKIETVFKCPYCNNTILLSGSYSLESVNNDLQKMQDVVLKIRCGQNIEAVKTLSRLLQISQQDAYELIEKLGEGFPVFTAGYRIDPDGRVFKLSEEGHAFLPVWDEEDMSNLIVLVTQRQKIEAIKQVRKMFNLGLKDAKEAVEKLEGGESVTIKNVAIEPNGVFTKNASWTDKEDGSGVGLAVFAELDRFIEKGDKAAAIRLYRKIHSVSLKEAKREVEARIKIQKKLRDGKN